MTSLCSGCPLRSAAALRPAPLPLLATGLAMGGNPLRAGHSRPCSCVAAPYGLLPLRASASCRGPGRSRLPLAVSQAMAGRPYREPGHGQPPIHA
ncbi:hypothetical protein GW17_00058928 [Ensete ventricosum]|nr:hypothetical protein GW17_00058928 [Ensete ventricosum]